MLNFHWDALNNLPFELELHHRRRLLHPRHDEIIT